jgi:hypothetical protein
MVGMASAYAELFDMNFATLEPELAEALAEAEAFINAK